MTDAMFSYDPATRILRGILLPFGEESRPSVSGAEPVMFSADAVELPRDPSVVTLNRHHNRFDPVGRATFLEKRAEGVYSEFAIADTDEGDAYLTEQRGTLRKLSAELADIVRDGARAVSSRLTGAALVSAPAFASAGLFAAIETSEHHDDQYTDENGTTWRRVADSTTVTEDDGTTTTTSTVTHTETETPPEADEADGTDQEEETALMSIVPGGATTTPRPTLDGLFAAIARNDADALAPYAAAGDLFALETLQHSGASTKTIGADTQETGYLGELWSKLPYRRRFVPLVTTATLTNYSMAGWKWSAGKSPEVGDYTGNTSEVPSNALDTEQVTVTASRLAGGHRLDRRFRDFNDQAVIASYLEHQADDYKRKSDAKVLAGLIASATATTPGTVPTGIAAGLSAIVDGALDVIAQENRPSFALVSAELWRDIILSPKDDVLAYLSAGFGLETGDLAGFSIQPAAVGTGKVIVGAREAYTFWELPGEAPIRVDGVVPGNGAEDVAVFGYYAQLANNAAAIRSVTVASGE